MKVSEVLKIMVKTGPELNTGHTKLPFHSHAWQHRLCAADEDHRLKPSHRLYRFCGAHTFFWVVDLCLWVYDQVVSFPLSLLRSQPAFLSFSLWLFDPYSHLLPPLLPPHPVLPNTPVKGGKDRNNRQRQYVRKTDILLEVPLYFPLPPWWPIPYPTQAQVTYWEVSIQQGRALVH